MNVSESTTPQETIKIINTIIGTLKDENLTTIKNLDAKNCDSIYTNLVHAINNYTTIESSQFTNDEKIGSSEYFTGALQGPNGALKLIGTNIDVKKEIIKKMTAFYKQVTQGPKLQTNVRRQAWAEPKPESVQLSNFAAAFTSYLKPYWTKAKLEMPSSDLDFFVTCFWTLIYVCKFQKYSISPLKNNSANCSFFIQTVQETEQLPKKNLFVKLVEYDLEKKYDDILIDNINGFILGKIVPLYYQNYFLTYIDSFLSIKKTVKENSYWALSRLNDVSKDKSLMSLNRSNVGRLPEGYKLANVSIFEAIDGISLDDILMERNRSFFKNKAEAFKEYHVKVIKEACICFEVFEFLGKNIGLMHNDLHFGNVFFDTDNQVVKLIDYGRMHIAKYEEKSNSLLNSFIKREIMRNCHPKYNKVETDNQYKAFMADFPFPKAKRKHCDIYIGYFSDVITFACNLYVYLVESLLFDGLETVVKNYIVDITMSDDLGRLPRYEWKFNSKITLDNLVTNYTYCYNEIINLECIKSDTSMHKIITLILDGLVLMSLVLKKDTYDNYFKFLETKNFDNFMEFLCGLNITGELPNKSRLNIFKTPSGGGLKKKRVKGGSPWPPGSLDVNKTTCARACISAPATPINNWVGKNASKEDILEEVKLALELERIPELNLEKEVTFADFEKSYENTLKKYKNKKEEFII